MISTFTIVMHPFLELLRLIFLASLNDLVLSSSQTEMSRLPESTIQRLTRNTNCWTSQQTSWLRMGAEMWKSML